MSNQVCRDEPMRVLVVGGDGQIGRALVAGLPGHGLAAIGSTRQPEQAGPNRVFLDLEGNLDGWICPEPIQAAVLAAAVTKIDACERDPEATARVNVGANLTLANLLASRGVYVVFLSSNQVFDGTRPHRLVSEPTSPQTVYGRQKAEVESRLLARDGKAAVLRLTKVVTPGLPLFNAWAASLRSGEPVRPFRDLVMAPLSVSFVVDVVAALVKCRPAGLLQASGPVDVTYADVAIHIARRVSADPTLVRPQDSSDNGLPAIFAPRNTTLDTSRLQNELGLIPPDVWSAIDSSLLPRDELTSKTNAS